MNLKISIRGVEEWKAYLKTVPHGTVRIALRAIVEWVLGNESRGLRHYEPYKEVSRARAGYGPMSDKQRRWFWANGGPDMIGNNRTNATANAWQSKETNNGYGQTVWNKSEGAKWIWSDQQARQPALVGHRTALEKIQTNIAGAIRHAQAAIHAWLKKK